MNLALISKWIWKIAQNDDSMWARVLKAKYFSDSSLFTTKIKGSQFWNGIQKCKEIFNLGARFEVGNEKDTKFWLSKWTDDKPRYAIYPNLFVIASDPEILVSNVFSPAKFLCVTSMILSLPHGKLYKFSLLILI